MFAQALKRHPLLLKGIVPGASSVRGGLVGS